LERLVGVWHVFDPSGAEATAGQIAYEWLQGGLYLLHHVNLKQSQGIEIIGYDQASKSVKSHLATMTHFRGIGNGKKTA
jgi:hypothetical protein